MSVDQILDETKQYQLKGTVRHLVDPHRGTGSCCVMEAVYESGGHFPPHCHDTDQTLLFLEGEGILFIGEDPHTVGNDSVIMIPAGTPHCIYNTGLGKLRLLSIFSTTEPTVKMVDGLFPANRPLPDEIDQIEEMAAVI